MKSNKLYSTIHEDEHILVISKPAGILTIPDRYSKDIPNLYHILKEEYNDNIFVVHRLDKDTSGVMVFAKHADAHKELNQQFQDHKVKKLYHCIVSGVVQQDDLRIDIPLIADPVKKGLTRPSARGKESLTLVKVINRYRVASLVECNLISGRHHQIRVHLASVGYPLLVDPDYGNLNEFFLSTIKRKFNLKKHEVERPIISRVSMHSYSLRIKHPKRKRYVEYISEYPKDFNALIQVLNKYSKVPDYRRDYEDDSE